MVDSSSEWMDDKVAGRNQLDRVRVGRWLLRRIRHVAVRVARGSPYRESHPPLASASWGGRRASTSLLSLERRLYKPST